MVTKPQPGSIVKIKTQKETLQGTLLESPDSKVILLKLSSGYNIGIKKKDIKQIKTIKKPEKQNEIKQINKLEKKQELKNIALIVVGGTISSKLDSTTGAVKWLTNPNELLKFYPEIKDISNITKIEMPFMIASENMSYKHWKKIAKITQKLLNNTGIAGVIITAGTDFLHYISAALSFFLKNLNKPVVLTYSQRSSDRASSDARLNLICSAKVAISNISEVMLVGHSSINDDFCYAMLGTKVRKMHTSRRDAFKPINTKPIAKIWADKNKPIKILANNYRKRDNNKKVKLNIKFNENIALIKYYPGQKPDFLNNKYDGIILEGSGLGHLATKEAKYNWLPKLKKAIKSGTIICVTSQTIFGRVDPIVYSPGRQLAKTGVIHLGDMLSETAYIKLGWTLAQTKDPKKVKEIMLKNISKEFNPKLGIEFIN